MSHHPNGPAGREPRTTCTPGPANSAPRASTTTTLPAALGVSKSSVSLWVRDMPRPERLSYEECRKRVSRGIAAATGRPSDRSARPGVKQVRAAAAGRDRRAVPSGRSSSPGRSPTGARAPRASRTGDRSAWSSSTAILALIRFFLRFLDEAGVASGRTDRSACTSTRPPMWPAAEQFWRGVTGAGASTVSPDRAEEAQPEDSPQERGRRLPRLPASLASGRAPTSTGGSKAGPAAIMADARGADAVGARCGQVSEPGHARAPGRGFEPLLTAPKPVVLPG